MNKVKYNGEDAILDKDNMLVWSLDGKYYAVVLECPYCGELLGTGLAYRADEIIYECAEDYAQHELARHIEKYHPSVEDM